MGNKNSGRRPQPTALKVLRGNPGQRKLNAQEPTPPQGDVVKPAGLSPTGALVWDEMAPICLVMGTLTTADVKSFRTFCELQATFEQAAASKGNPSFEPFVLQREDQGDPKSPYIVVIDTVLKLERDTAAALRPYYEKFGLEPVGRARISLPKSKAPENKWAALGLA